MTAILFIALFAATVWMGCYYTRHLMQELNDAFDIILNDDSQDPAGPAPVDGLPAPHPETD